MWHGCHLCEYKTRYKSNLNSHVKKTHFGHKTICQYCLKPYANIQQHIRLTCRLKHQKKEHQMNIQQTIKSVIRNCDTKCSSCDQNREILSALLARFKQQENSDVRNEMFEVIFFLTPTKLCNENDIL